MLAPPSRVSAPKGFAAPGGGVPGLELPWKPRTVSGFYGTALPRPYLLLDKTSGQVKTDRLAPPKVNEALLDWACNIPFKRGGLVDDAVRVSGRGAPRSLRGDSEDDDAGAQAQRRVKKPRSAASFYFLERRADHGSSVSFFQLKKLLCADYAKLTAQAQAPYQALAKADKERYRTEKAAAGGGGNKAKKAKATRRRKKPQGVRMGDSEDEWSDGEDEETESESEEAPSDEENEVPPPPPAPAPQPAHRRLRRLADAVAEAPVEATPAVVRTAPAQATQPVDATPSMGRTMTIGASQGAAGVGSHYRSVPASTVTSAGGIGGGGGAGDTAHWAPSSHGGNALMAPPAPPRWRGGLNGSQRVVTEPSPRVGLDATPGSTVGSVGATPRARAPHSVHRPGGADHHASRRRRLV